MRLELKRHWYTDNSTSGVLFVDGMAQCFVLEDVKRPDGVKVDGKTCIPAGEYWVIIDESARFKRLMPHILDVPGFSGVRIHSGNTAEQTEGCLLVGCERMPDMIMGSRLAFEKLFEKMKAATDEIRIVITDEPL